MSALNRIYEILNAAEVVRVRVIIETYGNNYYAYLEQKSCCSASLQTPEEALLDLLQLVEKKFLPIVKQRKQEKVDRLKEIVARLELDLTKNLNRLDEAIKELESHEKSE